MLQPPPGFEVTVAPDMPTLETARGPLERTILSLVGNAIKHHDKDVGDIKVAAREEGEFIVVTVTDDGTGIPQKMQDKAFQMFSTLKRRDEVEGSGMGLALVKKIVNHAGGTVKLTSEGRGCCFEFTWPKVWQEGS
jgi:signal transduction histidine kinase